MLGLKFAYATNGHDIIEIDYFTGTETRVADLSHARRPLAPLPARQRDRRRRKRRAAPDARTTHVGGKPPRYYQQIAINRTVEAILQGQKRAASHHGDRHGQDHRGLPDLLEALVDAAGTATGEHRKPRILYLADRNILVDDPKDKIFAAFGDARHKIESGEIVKSREMYFAIYQALAEDERRAGLFRTIRRTSSTSSSSMNATAAAPGTTALARRSLSISSPPISSA